MLAPYTPAGALLDSARNLVRPQTTVDGMLTALLALNSDNPEPLRIQRHECLTVAQAVLAERDA